jgi:2-dehydro-3-deoxygluconokinase
VASERPCATDMRLDVLTAGEPMVLFAAQDGGPLDAVQRFARSTAGAELNVAIGLARLGLKSAYLTRLGDDSFGRFISAAMKREGIDARHVAIDAARSTGFMLKSRSDDGSDPQIEYHRRGSAASAIDASALTADTLRGVRHLHLTGIYVAVSPSARAFVFALAQAARDAGVTISFDPNLRPSLWPSQGEMVSCLDALSRFADWVLPGVEEGRLLTGGETPQDIAAHYLERGARGVVVKLGARGAFYASTDAQGVSPGVPVARVVDTVGAGDGFAVGVISALLEGLSLADAAARGNAIGARVVQFPGDCDGLPTREQLREMRCG